MTTAIDRPRAGISETSAGKADATAMRAQQEQADREQGGHRYEAIPQVE